MSLFESIFKMPAFQKFAFDQLGSILVKGNYEMLVMKIDPADGGLLVQMFKPGEAVLTVLKPDDIQEIQANLITEKTDTNATD